MIETVRKNKIGIVITIATIILLGIAAYFIITTRDIIEIDDEFEGRMGSITTKLITLEGVENHEDTTPRIWNLSTINSFENLDALMDLEMGICLEERTFRCLVVCW